MADRLNKKTSSSVQQLINQQIQVGKWKATFKVVLSDGCVSEPMDLQEITKWHSEQKQQNASRNQTNSNLNTNEEESPKRINPMNEQGKNLLDIEDLVNLKCILYHSLCLFLFLLSLAFEFYVADRTNLTHFIQFFCENCQNDHRSFRSSKII